MERIITRLTPITPVLSPRKRVAAYARVSNDKDTMLHSLSAQVSFYSEHIQQKRDWQYMGVYADEAMTGTKDNRAEFQRLLSDCRAGKIDIVITKSISRFARNTVTILNTVRELKSLHVDVFFEKENIHSMSGDGELMLTILSSYAQAESLSVSENCKWRIRNKYKEGIPNTFEIFGFDVSKGKLEINPREADVVRMIFHDYLSGQGRLAIANKLNMLGIKTKRGREWDSSKIRDILRNEKYAGDLLLQKIFIANHLNKKNCHNNGRLPQYLVSSNHEAIIDRETFLKVQKEFEERKDKFKTDTATTNTYPFTGIITCGICGKHYQRKHNNAGTKYLKTVWICSTYNRIGKDFCNAKQIPESVLVNAANSFKKTIKQITAYPNNAIHILFSDDTIEEIKWNY